MAETTTQTPIFEFTGNWLCLDFINTVEDRPTPHPRELLNSYQDLVNWTQQAHIITDDEAQHLLAEAAHNPKDASDVLQRAIALREAIHGIFFAIAENSSSTEANLAIFNTELAATMSRACIVPKANGFVWDWTGKENALERILWMVVKSAADLLISGELHDVRVCSAPDCQWLFLDTSKNHSRRWCDMKGCGNRAKVRRHYERKKQSPT